METNFLRVAVVAIMACSCLTALAKLASFGLKSASDLKLSCVEFSSFSLTSFQVCSHESQLVFAISTKSNQMAFVYD